MVPEILILTFAILIPIVVAIFSGEESSLLVISVAAICFIGYIIAGLTANGWMALPICVVLLIASLFYFKKRNE